MSINKGQTEFESHNKLITFQPFALEKYMEIFIGTLDFLSSYDKKKGHKSFTTLGRRD